jgi:hypothetical protein
MEVAGNDPPIGFCLRLMELVAIGTAHYIDSTQVIDFQYGQKD